MTEWKEFAALDLDRIREQLTCPLVLDGRNLCSPDAMARAGLNYYSVGRATQDGSEALRGAAGCARITA